MFAHHIIVRLSVRLIALWSKRHSRRFVSWNVIIPWPSHRFNWHSHTELDYGIEHRHLAFQSGGAIFPACNYFLYIVIKRCGVDRVRLHRHWVCWSYISRLVNLFLFPLHHWITAVVRAGERLLRSFSLRIISNNLENYGKWLSDRRRSESWKRKGTRITDMRRGFYSYRVKWFQVT